MNLQLTDYEKELVEQCLMRRIEHIPRLQQKVRADRIKYLQTELEVLEDIMNRIAPEALSI